MNNKTSLEKSHSAWSNTKLTVLSIFTSIFASAFWLSLGFLKRISVIFNSAIAYIIIATFFALTIFCIVLFNKFTR